MAVNEKRLSIIVFQKQILIHNILIIYLQWYFEALLKYLGHINNSRPLVISKKKKKKFPEMSLRETLLNYRPNLAVIFKENLAIKKIQGTYYNI